MRVILILLAMIGLSSPARADWRKAVTEHFIIYSQGSEKELRAEGIRLERFDTLTRQKTHIPNTPTEQKLTIYFMSGIDAVQRVYDGKTKDVAGFYTTSPGGAMAIVPRIASGGEDYQLNETTVLYHEYAHHLMFQYFPGSYPAWYVEGFAEFVSMTKIAEDGTSKLGLPAQHRAYELLEEVTIPVERLLTTRVEDLKPGDVGNFYGQSWLLTHMLSFAPERSGQLVKYLGLIGSGTAALDAAKQSFGDLKTLRRDLDRYLAASRISYIQNASKISEPKAFTIAVVDRPIADTMVQRLMLMRGSRTEKRESVAASLRQMIVRYPASAEVFTMLAESELDAAHEDNALSAAESALKIDPANARAMLWKGVAMLRPLAAAKDYDPAKWKAGRAWIVRANRGNPEDPLPLLEYYLSFQSEGKAPPDIAISGLGKVLDLVPQEGGVRITYALALAHQKKFDDAEAVLRPVANSPHGGGEAEFARKIIGALKDARKSDSTSPVDDLLKRPDKDAKKS
jgi:thioredoxin-like negative regulator of GroEL